MANSPVGHRGPNAQARVMVVYSDDNVSAHTLAMYPEVNHVVVIQRSLEIVHLMLAQVHIILFILVFKGNSITLAHTCYFNSYSVDVDPWHIFLNKWHFRLPKTTFLR